MRELSLTGFVLFVLILSSIGLSFVPNLDGAHQTPHNNKAPEPSPLNDCDDGWHDGPPVNGVSSATAIVADGAGNIYVAGAQVAGRSITNGIAKWDGSEWSALGSGINGYVYGVAVSGSDVYVVGSFTTAGGVAANNIAKWNGSDWSALGSGLLGQINDIEISGNDIYVGGGYSDRPDDKYGYVSKWNGSNWTELGSGFEWTVDDIAVSGSYVYASAPDAPYPLSDSDLIAKWDGSNWAPLGAGPNGALYAIAASGTDVYAVGQRIVGGRGVGFLTKWNGTVWSEIDSGLPEAARWYLLDTIAVSETQVYVGGSLDVNQRGSWLGRWNGSSWSTLGDWVGYGTTAIAISGADVYFGGYGTFSSAGDVRRADGIAKWNGLSWSALGAGLYSIPEAFAQSGSNVYAGGYFTTDGGMTYSHAAIWNGTGWTQLGTWPHDPSTSRYVYDVAVSGADVYIGGQTKSTDGIYTGYVAKWNGSTWVSLGSGMTAPGNDALVSSLAILGNEVYAGGTFISAGGISANNIAKWNGSSWSPVGSGLSQFSTRNLAVYGTDVYAGQYQLAKWNGTSWTDLPLPSHSPFFRNSPGDFCCYIFDIDVLGMDLYVTDGFTDNYGTGTGFVSKWNGSNWKELGQMCCNPIHDIAIAGPTIYAVGDFYTANGTPANGVASWNGSTWTPLGSGVNGLPIAVAISGQDVFVGGGFAGEGQNFYGRGFTTAGCHVSAYFARYSRPKVIVSGRVVTPAGQGLRSALVSIVDTAGNRHSATTSTLGYYSIQGVPPGFSYTVTVSSRRFRFQPQTIAVESDLINIDFTGVE